MVLIFLYCVVQPLLVTGDALQEFCLSSLKFIVYYEIRHEAMTAYSQNTIKSLKTYMYIIIKAHAVQF